MSIDDFCLSCIILPFQSVVRRLMSKYELSGFETYASTSTKAAEWCLSYSRTYLFQFNVSEQSYLDISFLRFVPQSCCLLFQFVYSDFFLFDVRVQFSDNFCFCFQESLEVDVGREDSVTVLQSMTGRAEKGHQQHQ